MSRTLTYIRWHDASYKDAADSPEPIPDLSDLTEIGFLLGENEKAVLLGMEMDNDGSAPGRWRLSIPKINIVERKDVSFDSVFGTKKVRKPRKAKEQAEVAK